VALGGDEAHLGAALLDDGIGADRRAMRQEIDVAAKPVASIMPRAKSGGVEGTLVVRSLPARSTIAQSVKVPPISMPTR